MYKDTSLVDLPEIERPPILEEREVREIIIDGEPIVRCGVVWSGHLAMVASLGAYLGMNGYLGIVQGLWQGCWLRKGCEEEPARDGSCIWISPKADSLDGWCTTHLSLN